MCGGRTERNRWQPFVCSGLRHAGIAIAIRNANLSIRRSRKVVDKVAKRRRSNLLVCCVSTPGTGDASDSGKGVTSQPVKLIIKLKRFPRAQWCASHATEFGLIDRAYHIVGETESGGDCRRC